MGDDLCSCDGYWSSVLGLWVGEDEGGAGRRGRFCRHGRRGMSCELNESFAEVGGAVEIYVMPSSTQARIVQRETRVLR